MISPTNQVLLAALVAFVVNLHLALAAMSPEHLDKLTREQLLQLDRQVSRYYVESYDQLDLSRDHATTYDEQLFKSIKAIRHTNVVHHLDFRYTSNETRWRSMGARVDAQQCKRHLKILDQLARVTLGPNRTVPLSVADFFEASGKTGSGILNGNFVWLGSYITCERSRIPARVLSQALGLEALPADDLEATDIQGRYCVAHLRARAWPKWDLHFGDRVTLKRGVCLPESCHSYVYEQDQEIRLLVDRLARFDLLPPFDGQRYETQNLYCLPDEDSPHRQLDLGARLFILFGALWALLTLYANVKYHWRAQAVRRLRDTVDITMIINDSVPPRDMDNAVQVGADSLKASSTMAYLEADFLGGGDTQEAPDGDASPVPGSTQSSACVTPLPSDLEDDDSDPNHLIEPFRLRKRGRAGETKEKKKRANVNFSYKRGDGGVQAGETAAVADFASDWVRDFSIESNLEWLLTPREARLRQQRASETSHWQQHRGSNVVLQQLQQQAAAGQVARRTSNSNEALLRELQEQSQQQAAAGPLDSGEQTNGAIGSARRVHVDLLDGLKVIATVWIVLGHTLMFFFIFLKDLRFGVERMFDLTMTSLLNTLQVVGLFYVITGCLLTYFSFSKASRRLLLNPLFWLLVLVRRYVRLLPVYLLVFWFARHVAPHTGQGRDWLDYRTDGEHPRGYCARESWWVMLSMSAADVKIPMDCVPQAWYLSDDFRTLLVLPAYVFLLAKSARLGYAAILGTILYSTLRLAAILKAANIDYKILLSWHPHVYALMVDRLHDVYTDFFVRMSTYLLGVVVGHLLYLYEIRAIRRWPRWLRMRLPLLLAACFFFGVQLLSSPWLGGLLPARHQLDSAHVVWLIPLFKGSMELSMATIILLLVTGGGFPWARALLSNRVMKVLSNISYAVFLCHVEVMYKLPITRVESNYWQLLLYATFLVTFSHVVAFFIHLLYEVPLNNLSRRLLRRAAKWVS